MNDKWRGVLSRLSLGVVLGGKPKDVIEKEAVAVATEAVNDKLESTGLALCDRSHVQNALDLMNVAKSKMLAGRSTEALSYLDQARDELRVML